MKALICINKFKVRMNLFKTSLFNLCSRTVHEISNVHNEKYIQLIPYHVIYNL